MAAAYTDLLNEALDDLVTSLGTISGLQVVTDPRNMRPPCAFVNAPTFTTPLMTNKRWKLVFPVQVLVPGPFNLDAQRTLLNLAAKIMGANLAVMEGRPTSLDVGGALYPAYELQIYMEAKSS
jgi:hypothetical protein